MGFFKKVKDFVGIETVEETEQEEDLQQEPERTAPQPAPRKEPERTAPQPAPSYRSTAEKPKTASYETGALNRITRQLNVIVIDPQRFEDCPKLVDSLKAKKPVIINLEKVESETARKIFDFLSGATYALDGNMQKISPNIYLFAPENVDITAQKDGSLRSGIENPWK